MRFKPRPERAGFTLIELLVVIAIVAILAGLVIINLAGVRERARDTQRKSELTEVKSALRLYYNYYSRYPSESLTKISACSPAVTKNWGAFFSCGTMVYMKS